LVFIGKQNTMEFLSSISVDKIVSGSTCIISPIICGTTCIISPKFIEGGTCLANTYLGINACACDSRCLGGQLPSYYMKATVGLTGATNGLSTSSQNVKLGGNLTECTHIEGGYCFDINAVQGFNIVTSGNTDINIDAQQCGGFMVKSQCGSINSFPDFTNAIGFYGNIDQPSGFAIYDNRTGTSRTGIVYNADYSANYVPRSIPDKAYVDSVATGLNIHTSVLVATTGPVVLSGNSQTIDGVAVTTVISVNNRILVKNQASGATNGIYSASTGVWGRTSDYQTNVQITNGDLIPVISGSTQNSSIWALTTPEPITVGTTPLNYTQFSTVVDVQAGNGIDVVQTGGVHTVSVQLATNCGLIFCGTGLAINPWVGTTVNGVGTFVNATCICSNPNMTFDGTSLIVTGNVQASTYVCSPIITGSTKICSPIVCGTSCVTSPITCGTTCVTSPITCGTTCVTTPILLASTYACSPIITGSTKVCSPITIGTTCVCSPIILGSTCVCGTIICSNTCMLAGTCVTGTIACFSSCVRSPILSGSTCVTGTLVCGACGYFSTIVCSPVITGSTKVCSPITIGTTCVCSPIILASTSSCSPIHCGACGYFATIVCSPVITGSTKVCSPITIGTSCVCSPIVLGSTCVCGAIVCSNTCIIAGTCVSGTIICGTTCTKTPIIQLTSVSAKGAETAVAFINSAGCITSGTSAGGGINWAGTTANGVGTYVSATCICSNPNMTFDGTNAIISSSNSSYGILRIKSTTTGEASINYRDCIGTDACSWTVGKGTGGIGSSFGFYWGANKMVISTGGTITHTIVGTCNTLLLSAPTAAPTYNSISLNGTQAEGFYMGMAGGGGGDQTLYLQAGCNGDIQLRNGNGAAEVVRMLICGDGRVTIGTTTPNGQFTVGAVCTAAAGCGAGIGIFRIQGGEAFLGWGDRACNAADANMFWGWYATGGITYLYDGKAGANRIAVSTATGNVTISCCGLATDFIATSDCRLKKCIKPIIGALSTVLQLQGVCYELCDDEKHLKQLGLIAQDVNIILPEIVSHSKPSEADYKYDICDDKLGLKYDKLSAVLIEAIKEQQKQIKELDKKINCLCLDLNYMRNSTRFE
jgi:hypothetical protein